MDHKHSGPILFHNILLPTLSKDRQYTIIAILDFPYILLHVLQHDILWSNSQ